MTTTKLVDAKERYALGRERRKQMRRMQHKTWNAKGPSRESAETAGGVDARASAGAGGAEEPVDGGIAVWVLSRGSPGDGV